MANTKTESKNTKKVDKSRELYYFYSQGCGWCKRTEPLIDELNNEGYNILKLDLADGDNKIPARLSARLYKNALHLFPPNKNNWRPKVLTCSALKGLNIE